MLLVSPMSVLCLMYSVCLNFYEICPGLLFLYPNVQVSSYLINTVYSFTQKEKVEIIGGILETLKDSTVTEDQLVVDVSE